MTYLSVNFSPFISNLLDSFFNVLGQYIFVLKSVILFHIGSGGSSLDITAFDLRIGVLFLQIFFGIVFILAPRLGGGSVLKGNGV